MARKALSIEDGNLTAASTLEATQNREYIDIDMSLAARPVTGDIFKKKNGEAVKQSVKNLLLTNRGEKPFSPYFGANLSDYLFELADEDVIPGIVYTIRENIRVFEPRVDADSVDVNVNISSDYNTLEITIIFRIVNTNEEVEFTTRLNRLR